MYVVSSVGHAARRLFHRPLFSLLAVLGIAMGMWVVAIAYSIVDVVALRPLPYRDSDRLVTLYLGARGFEGVDDSDMGAPNWCITDWREHLSSVESIALMQDSFKEGIVLQQDGAPPERLLGARVSTNFFKVFAIDALRGRVFSPGDAQTQAGRVAVLENGFWQRRFGGDPAIVGKTLLLDSVPYEVIGVLPATPLPKRWVASNHYKQPEIWIPLDESQFSKQDVGNLWAKQYAVYARLKKDVTLAQARLELGAATERLYEAGPGWKPRVDGANSSTGAQVRVVPLVEYSTYWARRFLATLLGAALVVWVIASVNIANLFLARGVDMQRDAAVRGALGAPRFALMGHLLSESVLLAAVGGLLGALAAYAFLPAIASILPSMLPRREEIQVDFRILAVLFLWALAMGGVCGVFPSYRLSRPNLQQIMSESGRGSSGRVHNAFRNTLVALQIAASIVIVDFGIGTLLPLARHMREDAGFSERGVLSMCVDLPKQGDEKDALHFTTTVRNALAALPDAQAVCLASCWPMTGYNTGAYYRIVGLPGFGGNLQELPCASFAVVSHGYFETLGIPFKEGEDFDVAGEKEDVAIVDEDMANAWFKGRSPIGSQIELLRDEKPKTFRIIGVVGHAKYWVGERKDDNIGQVYVSFDSYPIPDKNRDIVYLATRAKGDNPYSPLASARTTIAALYPGRPLYQIQSMEEQRALSLAGERGMTTLIGLFAGVGLLLAGIGCYGVLAYRVAQRRHELGVRIALGATSAGIALLVMRQASVLFGFGGMVGFAALSALKPALAGSKIFYARDPFTAYVNVVSIVVVVAIASVAACVAARKAARIQPAAALRGG